MGRIRTVKPEFFTHEELSELSAETHLFAAALLCYADDYGYFNANPKLIKAAIFPIRETSGTIPEMLRKLSGIGYVRLGITSEGKAVGQVITFADHQRVSHATPSRFSNLSIKWEGSGIVPEDSGTIREDSGNDPKNIGKPPESFRLKGKEQGKEGSPPEELAPEMVAKAVMDDLRISGLQLSVAVTAQARLEMNNGADPHEVRTRMVSAAEDYERSKPRLEFKWGWESFFGGHWRNREGWPWKQSQTPTTKTVRAIDKLHQQESHAH